MIKRDKYNSYFYFILIYILIQPIIDISISYFLLKLHISITPGLLIRNMALIIAILYVIFIEKKHSLFLLLAGIYYAIHFITNYFYKDLFNIYQETSYFSKYIFFIVVLFTINHNLRLADSSIMKEKLVKCLWIVMNIMSICIIMATITHTGISSYGSEKIGQIGWFFSGTKISASMAILFPLSLLYSIQNYSNSKMLYLVLILCNIISMFITGTKTSYMGLLLGLFAALAVVSFVKDNKLKPLIIVILALVIGVGVYTPFSPVYRNIKIHQSWQEDTKPDLIFNGREIKVDKVQEDYLSSNIFRKMVGVGYGGDYTDVDYIIPVERDFHELFFYYGIVGFLLLLYYPIKITLSIVSSQWQNRKKAKLEDTMLMTSLFAGFGSSFIAGHVLFAPSVSIYFACVLSMLWYKRGKSR